MAEKLVFGPEVASRSVNCIVRESLCGNSKLASAGQQETVISHQL